MAAAGAVVVVVRIRARSDALNTGRVSFLIVVVLAVVALRRSLRIAGPGRDSRVDSGHTRAERCLLRRRSSRRLHGSKLRGRFGHVDARRGQELLHPLSSQLRGRFENVDAQRLRGELLYPPTHAKQLQLELLLQGCVHRRRLQHLDCAGRAGIAPQRRRGPRDQLLLLFRRALVAVF